MQYKTTADCLNALSRATVRRGLVGNAGTNENHVCTLIKTYYCTMPTTKLNSICFIQECRIWQVNIYKYNNHLEPHLDIY